MTSGAEDWMATSVGSHLGVGYTGIAQVWTGHGGVRGMGPEPTPESLSMPRLPSREEYWDYFEGWQSGAWSADIRSHRTPVVKSFLVETVRTGDKNPTPQEMLRQAGAFVEPVDDTLFRVASAPGADPWALAEVIDHRFFALYTTLPVKDVRPRVRALVDGCVWLDRVWISRPVFERLWEYVKTCCAPHRYVKLSFEYEARYELEGREPNDGHQPEAELDEETDERSQDTAVPERRSARCTLLDRLREVQEKIDRLRDIYRPFHSIIQLRIPASGRGGHDFYFDGQVTNRSDSFADHRQQLSYVLELYRRTTEKAEDILWTRLDGRPEGLLAQGAPVLMQFAEPLPEDVFKRWVNSIFRRRNNAFRLWGHPIEAGPDTVHVYGIDRHLWQRIYLEFARGHLLAFLPEGTCGNTVHRLVTNVQRLIDPAVKVWIGNLSYEAVVATEPRPGRVDGGPRR